MFEGPRNEAISIDDALVAVKLDAKWPTQATFGQVQTTIRQQFQALTLERASAQFVGGLLKSAVIQQSNVVRPRRDAAYECGIEEVTSS